MLKSLVVELITRDPLDNPFEKEQILIQSQGMSQWLKIELAQAFGIAANIEFTLPARFIWQLFHQILPNVPQRSIFERETMRWKLIKLLPTLLDRPEFLPLKHYLGGDASETIGLNRSYYNSNDSADDNRVDQSCVDEVNDDGSKLYQLATKIADVFDTYLVYRPEWIAAWEARLPVAELMDEQPWQGILWHALYEDAVAQGQLPHHRANLYQDFIQYLTHEAHRITKQQLDSSITMLLPKRLFVFGITALPPCYLEVLKALGEHIDVHFMLTNPCRYYWGDIRDQKHLSRLAAKQRQPLQWQAIYSGYNQATTESSWVHHANASNNLLASMGKLGRDNLYLLSQLESNEIDVFVEIKRDSLLHHIQADILDMVEHQDVSKLDSSEHKQEISLQDRSLHVHICHSAMREVEVLHDQLLAMFDADPHLKPRDIIVMVSDINAYSAAIQAVFGNAPLERFIPYSISDRNISQENPIITAFMTLMTLPKSRCLAHQLLELLETPAIMAKFAINAQQFAQIKNWVEQAGIRWGLDEQTAKEFGLPATKQNTWQFGIERMLLGYAMPDSAGLWYINESKERDGETIAAYNEVQGIDAELAGKLAQFIALIRHYRYALNQPQSIEQWHQLITQLLGDFFSVDLEGGTVLASIQDALVQLKQQLNDAGLSILNRDELTSEQHIEDDFKLTPAILILSLQSHLSNIQTNPRFLAGQVNFCTLMPMRSIPFQKVCLLGMNDGAYPRANPINGFDLIVERGRAGDRSRRDDDRYLFLEALQSAQQSLYISYVGRSILDNSEHMPSVLVTELLEYCQQNYVLSGDKELTNDRSAERLYQSLTTVHAMMPFSPKAFELGHHSGSYAKEWLPTVVQMNHKIVSSSQRTGNLWLSSSLSHSSTNSIDNTAIVNESQPLELIEFQRFWRLPVAYFFNHHLKVFFEAPSEGIADSEPFSLDGLQRFLLKEPLIKQLLEHALDENIDHNHKDVVAAYFQSLRAQGKLAVGAFGELEFDKNQQQAHELVQELLPLYQKKLDDIEVRLSLTLANGNTVEMFGWLTQYYQSGLIRYRSGSIRPQDFVSAWIDHLCLTLALSDQNRVEYNELNQANVTHLLGYNSTKKEVEHWCFSAITEPQYALDTLIELLELFQQGNRQPLTYFPATAWAASEVYFKQGKWIDDENKQTLQELSQQKMSESFHGDYQWQGEGGNAYISRVWPQWDDELARQVEHCAEVVFKKLRQSVERFAQPSAQK